MKFEPGKYYTRRKDKDGIIVEERIHVLGWLQGSDLFVGRVLVAEALEGRIPKLFPIREEAPVEWFEDEPWKGEQCGESHSSP